MKSEVTPGNLPNTRNPWRMAASVAAQFLDVRETSRNQHPAIKSFWTAVPGCETYFDDREPWCAAFVSFCVGYSWKNEPRCQAMKMPPAFPAVVQWLHWCQLHATRIPKADADAGDIAIFLPRLSHIGIVTGQVGWGCESLFTIEGNTNQAGGREGDGVFRKKRDWELIGSIWRLPFVACLALCFGGCVSGPNSRLTISPVVSLAPVVPDAGK